MSVLVQLASLQGQQLTQASVDKIVDIARKNPIDTTTLTTSLGDTLAKIFPLEPAEVKMLNSLPAETVASLIALCTRAVTSPGGSVQYSRCDSGGPEFHVSHTEVVNLKPAGGGGPQSTVNVSIRCMK
jgi:hypothetical protein